MRSDFYLKLNYPARAALEFFAEQHAIECSQAGRRTLSIQRSIG